MGELWYLFTLPDAINPIFGNGERCVPLADNVVTILNPPGSPARSKSARRSRVKSFSGFCDTA